MNQPGPSRMKPANKLVEFKRPLKRILPKLPNILPDSVLQIPHAEVEENVQLRICYICDARLTKGVRLVNSRFTSPNVGLPAKIVELMGDSFIVIATEDDLICPKCHSMFLQAERLERELEYVRKVLRTHLMKKYGIEEALSAGIVNVEENKVVKRKNKEAILKSTDNGLVVVSNKATPKTSFEFKPRNATQSHSCTMCDFICDSVRALKSHKVNAHLTNWICHFCNEVFENENAFTDHTKIHLSDSTNQVRNFTCTTCGDVFTKEQSLIDHESIHNQDLITSGDENRQQTFTCPMCDIQFLEESFYNDHLQSHEALNSLDLHALEKNELILDSFEPNTESVDLLDMNIFDNAEPPMTKMSRLVCANCESEYETIEEMNEHFEAEHQMKQCSLCPEVVGTREHVDAHVLEVHGSSSAPDGMEVKEELQMETQEMICMQCGQNGETEESILHLSDCFVGKALNCVKCGAFAESEEVLAQHFETCGQAAGETAVQDNEDGSEINPEKPPEQTINVKKRRPITCMPCGLIFENKKLLSEHEREFPDHLVIACPDCNQKFARERLLNEHREEVHEICHCRHCSKAFVNVKQLKAHENRHIRMARSVYKCSVCERIFQTQTGLRDHVAVHTGEYKFKCEFCGKGFVSRVRHEEHRACHTKEERYTCEVCGLKFSVQSTYWIHKKWHDNPRPYECQECGMRYKHSSLLAVHKRKHTGERPYACQYCDQTFIVSNSLKRHMTLHTGSFPYSCSTCNVGFPARHKLAQHMSKVHNDNALLLEQMKKKDRNLKVALKEPASSPKEQIQEAWVLAEDPTTPGEYLTIETEQGERILVSQRMLHEKQDDQLVEIVLQQADQESMVMQNLS